MINILTLNWNGSDKLSKLYPTFKRCLQGLDFRWYIKDNGSIDDSVKTIESWNDPNVMLVKCSHNNDNFSLGCNILYRQSQAKPEDYILLLNNDVVFNDTKSIKSMISLMKDDVGVVGAKLKYTNTDKIQHAGVVFSERTNRFPTHLGANNFNEHRYDANREFQAVTGACLLTKAKYYEQVCTANKSKLNGQDENLFWCFDDIDLCLSIKYKQNKKIVYCGSTNIYHEESASLKVNPVNKLFFNHNINYFRTKWDNIIIMDKDFYINDTNYNVIHL